MMFPQIDRLPPMLEMPWPVAQPITLRSAGRTPPITLPNPPSPTPTFEVPAVTEQPVPAAPTPMKFPAMVLLLPETWMALLDDGQFVRARPRTTTPSPPASKRFPPVMPEPSSTTPITAFEPSRAAGSELGEEPGCVYPSITVSEQLKLNPLLVEIVPGGRLKWMANVSGP